MLGDVRLGSVCLNQFKGNLVLMGRAVHVRQGLARIGMSKYGYIGWVKRDKVRYVYSKFAKAKYTD